MGYLAGRRTLAANTALVLLGTALFGFALQGCRQGDSSRGADDREVRNLLVRGAAHSGIDEWAEALALFERAAELVPGDPAVRYDLALAHYRLGDLDATRDELAGIADDAPADIRARAAYLTGKLALEAGDTEAEAEAYGRALDLDPGNAAYPYSLSQLAPRLVPVDATDEQVDQAARDVGRLLRDARTAWPGNTRLEAEYAQWALSRPDPETRAEGLAVLESLAAGNEALLEQVALGRDELAAAADSTRVPVPLRRALNLLRPTKPFQTDSARFEDSLQVSALARPTGDAATPGPAKPAPDVQLTAAELLPAPPPGEDETWIALVPFHDAADPVPDGPREAHLALLGSSGLWLLEADDDTWTSIAAGVAGSWLAAGELDGDGIMELVVLGPAGARVWARTADSSWTETDLAPELAEASLHDGLLLDFEHDGDLDLLALDDAGRTVLVTHRGEAGWGAPAAAPLPATEGSIHAFAAADLDGDDDRDLILSSDDALVLLRNWRQGEFLPWDRWPTTGPAGDVLPTDIDNDGDFDVVFVTDDELRVRRNLGDSGFDEDQVVSLASASSPALAAMSVVDLDLDLDGDRDLVVAGTSATGDGATYDSFVVLENRGAGELVAGPALPGGENGGVDLLPLDLDGDRDVDLLARSATGLTAYRADGAEDQSWIRLGLRGLAGKVPLDGRGARIMVADSDRRQWLTTERPEITVGLGDREPALVQVTWPNGISEYIFAPEAGVRHPVEQVLRIEGSCPFLYATDERGEMRFITDILGLAPLGMLGGVDRYIPADPEEYLRLPDWVSATAGELELRITEELREVAYLDQVELVAVDAPETIEVYNGERWLERPIDGLELRLLGPLVPPLAVRDDTGRDVLEIVAREDQRYLTNHSVERLYQGAAEPHSIEIELPADALAGGRPALLLVGWLHWGNTSVNLARDQDPRGAPVFPYLEVPDGRGGWRRTAIEVGLPAGKTKPVVVDLADVVDPADPRVRITTDFEVYWDRIAAGTLLPETETPHRIQRLAPEEALLAWGGFARWYRPAANGPYLFDYADRRDWPRREQPGGGERPLSWREHEGFYTEFGEVTDLVSAIDDRQVVLGAGEELTLRYAASDLAPPPPGWRRTWFLHNEGWEKDGDPNVACSQTVAPLPSRTMKAYPCPEALGDSATPSSLHDLGSATDRRTRWVSRDRLERRLWQHLELHSLENHGLEKPTRLSAVPDGNAGPQEEAR